MSSFSGAARSPTSTEEGTGLGLPIVKGMVELHGGQFRLTSKLRQAEAVVVFPPEWVRRASGADTDASPEGQDRRALRLRRKRRDGGVTGSKRGLFAEARRLDGEMRPVLEAGVLARSGAASATARSAFDPSR